MSSGYFAPESGASHGINALMKASTAGSAMTFVIPAITVSEVPTHSTPASSPAAPTMSAHIDAKATTATKAVRMVARQR